METGKQELKSAKCCFKPSVNLPKNQQYNPRNTRNKADIKHTMLIERVNRFTEPTRHIPGASSVNHILIKADNKDFLEEVMDTDKLNLRNTIDLCYIDPPYNTGNTKVNGFVYHDDFQDSASWLEFMRKRLTPLPVILKDTGVILVSIDDSEVHRLRVLMDEIFGTRNFIAQLVVDGGNPKNNAKFFSISHEYILVYANNLNKLRKSGIKWRKRREGIDLLLKEYKQQKKIHGNDYNKITTHLKTWNKQAPLTPRLKLFYNADEKGLYTYADLSTPGNGPQYDVIHPITLKPCQVPSRGWGVSKENMANLIETNQIIFGETETMQPMKKLYLKDEKDQVQSGILSYPSRSSTHLLEKLLGRRSSFNNPKNLRMMMDLIDLICPENGTTLDYFGGSGTTGHAVIELNRTKHATRKFILVTNNENDIFDTVTLPRLETVLTAWSQHKVNNAADGMMVYGGEAADFVRLLT
jgi:adenine-specific DNA-methyltransferase